MDTTNETALPKLSTLPLDLTNLPARLDDSTMSQLTAFLRSPLPDLPACPERHFNQCFRLMDAVLPKRSSDDISGQLMVAAYRRILGSYPELAISYMTEHVLQNCKWLPTIAEGREILEGWQRNDEHAKQRAKAARAVLAEKRARDEERAAKLAAEAPEITQEDVEGMDPAVIRLGLLCGALVKNSDGSVSVAPQGEGE